MATDEAITPAWFGELFRVLWRNAVQRRYETGVINSERALQACIVEALAPLAPEIVALVEPEVRVAPHTDKFKPDLWVGCPQTQTALAMIELKYKPHHYPEWEQDFKKFQRLLRVPGAHACMIDPFSGRDDYTCRLICTDETIAIFAVVGRHDAKAIGLDFDRHVGPTADQRKLPRTLHVWGIVYNDRERATSFGSQWLD